MKYICVQPDIPYFHWQIAVMLTNFLNVGIKLSQCNIILLHQGNISQESLALQNQFPEAEFFWHLDEREDKSYIPSIKPYGMYKHIQTYPNAFNGPIFYHDSDIIFRKKIDEQLFVNDNVWYLSNTVSYIGWEYIVSKGEGQADAICSNFGIDKQILIDNQDNSGGAQYIIKNTTEQFWLKVYQDSNRLYKYLCDKETECGIINPKDPYPIQKWCAEMWATLWNAWLFNHKTQIHAELDFCFATSPYKEFEQVKILHNAGVTNAEKHNMFFKGDFIHNSPFNADLSYVSNQFSSFAYKQAVENVAY